MALTTWCVLCTKALCQCLQIHILSRGHGVPLFENVYFGSCPYLTCILCLQSFYSVTMRLLQAHCPHERLEHFRARAARQAKLSAKTFASVLRCKAAGALAVSSSLGSAITRPSAALLAATEAMVADAEAEAAAVEAVVAAELVPWRAGEWAVWFSAMLGTEASLPMHQLPQTQQQQVPCAPALPLPHSSYQIAHRVAGPAVSGNARLKQGSLSARINRPASFVLTRERTEIYRRLLTGQGAATPAAIWAADGYKTNSAVRPPPVDWPSGPTPRPTRDDPVILLERQKRLEALSTPTARRWRNTQRQGSSRLGAGQEPDAEVAKGCWCNHELPRHNGMMYALRCRTAITGAPTFCPWRFRRGRIAFGPQVFKILVL